MYEPEFTVITPTSNIVDAGLTDDFSLLVNLLDRQTYPYIEHIALVYKNVYPSGCGAL